MVFGFLWTKAVMWYLGRIRGGYFSYYPVLHWVSVLVLVSSFLSLGCCSKIYCVVLFHSSFLTEKYYELSLESFESNALVYFLIKYTEKKNLRTRPEFILILVGI